MSFFGSDERRSYGAGVSKLLEDNPNDWWMKYLTSVANGVRAKPVPTGGGLVTQINKMINPRIATKFGHTFNGKVNRSYVDEKLLFDAIGDINKLSVIDYNVGTTVGMQVSNYMYQTYGMPSYGTFKEYVPYWNVGGSDVYMKSTSLGYTGQYPYKRLSTITIHLVDYYTDEKVLDVDIPYSDEPICAITYKTKTTYIVPTVLVDNDESFLVDNSQVMLSDGSETLVEELVWFCPFKDVAIERYDYSPFFVLDYKRKGIINPSKYIFLLNERLGLGNNPDPCFRDDSSSYRPSYNWSTTVLKTQPKDMFSVKPASVSTKDCDSHGGDPSTLKGIIAKEDNRTVLFTHAMRYVDDNINNEYKRDNGGLDHPQLKYKGIIDELLDVDGKYNIGFRPQRASGKDARSNFRGKGLGGYIINVHDVQIAYVDYFVVAQDTNDYGTIDKILGWFGKDEEVPDQCETRDPTTGYSMVIDRIPIRTVDGDGEGGCKSEFNDTVIQYMIPYDIMDKYVMTEKYRAFKESATIIIQATQVRKLKWYETGLFKIALIIIQLYISYITFGAYAALGLFALGILIDYLDVNPYVKIAINVIVGLAFGDVSAILSLSNVMSIAQQLATVYMSEYFKEQMSEIRMELEKLTDEQKAVQKALNKLKRDALYSPLDAINTSYSMSYELLYESYGAATSVDGMLELDKQGIK